MDEDRFRYYLDALYALCGRADQDPDIAWELPMLMVGLTTRVFTEEPARSWVERWRRGEAPLLAGAGHEELDGEAI